MVPNSGGIPMDSCTKAGTPRHETLLRKLWEPASEGLSCGRWIPRCKNDGIPGNMVDL